MSKTRSCNGWACPIREICLRYLQFKQWCNKEIKFCGLIIADYNKETNKCNNYKPIEQ